MIKPLNDNIIVKLIEDEEPKEDKNKILVYTKKDDNNTKKAFVIDSGNTYFKNDSVVLINKFSAVPVKHDNTLYHVVNANDIIAIVE